MWGYTYTTTSGRTFAVQFGETTACTTYEITQTKIQIKRQGAVKITSTLPMFN